MVQTGIVVIAGVCIMVLGIGILGKKAEIFINFILRLVFGMIAIYFINGALAWAGLELCVGLNLFNGAACGFLGIPGIALLYSVKLVSMF